MREGFCRLADSKTRIYYCSTSGRILSVSKSNGNRRFLKELSGRPHVVAIMGRKVPVLLAMARCFHKDYLKPGTTFKVRFIDGNEDNLNIANIVFYFSEEPEEKGGQDAETDKLDCDLRMDG